MSNTTYLSGCPSIREQLVNEFNLKALRILIVYGGYSSTKVLRIYTRYGESGVRKRLNYLTKIGMIHKVKTNSITAGVQNFWAITKAGSDFYSKQDKHKLFEYPSKRCLARDIKPSQINHTLHTQAVVAKIDHYESRKIVHVRTPKLQVFDGRGRFTKKYYVPDAMLCYGKTSNDANIYAAIEVELTPKTRSRYEEIFTRICGAIGSNSNDQKYLFNGVYYVCPPHLYEQIFNIFQRISQPQLRGTRVYLLSFSELKNFSFQDERFLVLDL
jgi:hypothetical protein